MRQADKEVQKDKVRQRQVRMCAKKRERGRRNIREREMKKKQALMERVFQTKREKDKE